MATATPLMTTDDLLAMPRNGMEKWLVDGELRERPITLRNRFHSFCMTAIATELENWRRKQPEPRGQVLTGDAGVRLRRDPDTTVGVDVAYIAPDVVAQWGSQSTIVDGIPTLAVEILSPSDKMEDIHDKIDTYLTAGVPLVWIADPHLRTITVHQHHGEPELFNVSQEVTGNSHLPGFRVPVRNLFE